MRKLFGLALLVPCLAVPAQADPASRDLTIQGHVDKFCSIAGTLTQGVGDTLTLSGDTVTIEDFANAAGQHTTKNFQLKFPGTLCNYKARFRLASANGALQNTGVVDAAGTARKVFYQVNGGWNGVNAELLAEGSPVNAASTYTDGYLNTDLILDFSTMRRRRAWFCKAAPTAIR